MKICLIIPSFFPAVSYGGPVYSSYNTCIELSKLSDISLFVSTTNANMNRGSLDVIVNKRLEINNKFHVKYYQVLFGTFSLSLIRNLWDDIKDSDVIHIQGIFNSSTPIALIYAVILKKPVIISPRGVLGLWCLLKRSLLKKIWLKFLIKPYADNIDWHATSIQERDEIHALFPKANVTIIHNGVYVNEFRSSNKLTKDDYLKKFVGIHCSEVEYLVISMGRLSKKKGFDILIKSFKNIVEINKNSYLLIAGPEESEEKALLKLIKTLKLSENVFLIGSLKDQDKIDFFANADVFVLPSHNENFGNVYLESLASGTPIIASINTPWEEVENGHCGKWVTNNLKDITEATLKILKSDKEKLKRNSFLMASHFDWKIIAKSFHCRYKELTKLK